MREFVVNVKGKKRLPDYSLEIAMLLDDKLDDSASFFNPQRGLGKKPYRQEDIEFATKAM